MTQKERVLFVSQEVVPYLPESNIGKIGRHLPQGTQERGREIRTFMPRFGCINERRNQLHEVIRLSGMNLIIDDTDHPLIIKVASIQPARMQVYFIDNEEYFQRKFFLKGKDGKFFSDNDERAIFFCRGVIETVKKLGWAPNVIHCHGWMTALLPFLIKTVYKDDPIFENSKIVYSVYNDRFEGQLNDRFAEKVKFDTLGDADVADFGDSSHIGLTRAAIKYADAVIIGEEELTPEAAAEATGCDKPVLGFQDEDSYLDAYSEFYTEILAEASILAD
ncbi:MAG: glycogen/starch synthase [Flavobacteriales bacterium]|nr:glycogen/starch synthase [Flavobacteriales bacterium]MCB9190882.1 glycogen/starch synthase [Flavobacteriales bacterium]MCB9205367.1 glycogen/starch synthase [Flavobacteriales bacterium]